MDWLSRLFETMAARGRVDLALLLRCDLVDRAGAA
jgi:hypothetical protein